MIILVADLLIVVLVSVVAWVLPMLARPDLPFGVRVPPGRATDPVVVRQRHHYVRRVTGLGGLAAAVCAAMAVLDRPEHAPSMIAATLGTADGIAYVLANRRIRAAKARENWYLGLRQGATTDTALRTQPVRVSVSWFLPAVLVLLATLAVGLARYGGLPETLPAPRSLGVDSGDRVTTSPTTAFAPVLMQAVLALLMPLLAVGLTRARPELDAARPRASARRYRVYLTRVIRLIAVTAGCGNLAALFFALQLWELWTPSAPLNALTCLPLLAAFAVWLRFEFRVGQAGHRLPAEPGEETGEAEEAATWRLVQRDDDRHWHLAGFVYANRTDPALFVHQRAGGASWTLNLGHPVACAVLGALALLGLLSAVGVIPLSTGVVSAGSG
ncbi:hypothetical protein LHJ74_20880 [Streptomyces sp. N2-109]|uniref:DUF5808 domain-containing protein n=1 Tax=Streptomyces gossypii TaxID=2883101 RepID=A0ABT2JWP9_9ACTN|nr:hypothetical protein [Streptomyces gossypii]MCT2592328.1 hypothetical protein [Streptomyces gossypii]